MGTPTWMTTALIHRVFKRQHCIACEISKRRTLPQQIGSGIKENVVGHTLSADYVGPCIYTKNLRRSEWIYYI